MLFDDPFHPHTDKELLVESYLRGHSFNPEYPHLQTLDLDRISKMNGDEQDAKDLMASRQKSDENFDRLALFIHNRPANHDGEIGPATRHLALLQRCPMPDFAPPPGARIDTGIPELNAAIESMQRAAAMGSGSWPSCDPERPNVNSLRIRIDISRCPSTIRAYLDKALQAVVECYAEVGCALRYILNDNSADCEIQKRFEPLAGGVIGWNEFPNPNTCDQVIDGRLDTGYAPTDWRYWANLEAHETGHGVGLQHTRGHIMNPSILLVWRDSPKPNISWKGGPSEAAMNRYFGGQPIPGGPTSPPEISQPELVGPVFGQKVEGNYVLRGVVQQEIKPDQKPGIFRYILEPTAPGSDQFRFVKAAQV
jgi:hypothetical protein